MAKQLLKCSWVHSLNLLLIQYFILLCWLILYVCGYMGDLSVCLAANTKLFSSRTAVYCTVAAFRIGVHAIKLCS